MAERLDQAPLDLALQAWSATNRARNEFAAGYGAVLGPYLAGWFTCAMGAKEPSLGELGTFSSSYRAGWRDCEGHLRIASRETPHVFASTGAPDWCVCGLHRYHHAIPGVSHG